MLLDILFVFRTGYVDHAGMVIFDGGAVAKRYVRSWKFWMDLMCSIPWELLLYFGNINLPGENEDGHLWYSILKLNQLLRIHKIINNESLDIQLQLPHLRIFKLFFVWFLFAHFFALFYIFIGHLEQDALDPTLMVTTPLNPHSMGGYKPMHTTSWLDEVGLANAPNFEVYTDALYWALATMVST